MRAARPPETLYGVKQSMRGFMFFIDFELQISLYPERVIKASDRIAVRSDHFGAHSGAQTPDLEAARFNIA